MALIPYKVIFFDLGNTLVVSGEGWVPNARTIITQLHELGVRLGIISNTGGLTRTQLLALLPPDFDMNIFEADLVILSSELGVEKPALEIFQRALHQAAVEPAACLFCTEDLLDTLAAQQVGMCAARLQPSPNGDIGTLIQRIEDLSGVIA